MQKRYNLATPELISTLVEVGAVADPTKKWGKQCLYRVLVRDEYVDEINQLLTGSLLQPMCTGWYCLYSKDIWHAIQDSDERRTSYGHTLEPRKTKATLNEYETVTHHCGQRVKSFTFSDKSKAVLCRNLACTVFDAKRRRVLAAPMKGAR